MSQAQMKTLFSTQIHYKKLTPKLHSWSLADLKKESHQIKDSDRPGQIWSAKNYKNGYTSYGSNQSGFDRLHKVSSTFLALEKSIDKHVAQFIKSLDFDIKPRDLAMTHCWVNIMGQDSAHSSHAHPLSVISGTFYVDIPKGASTLKFEDPRMNLFMNSPPIKDKAKRPHQRIVEIKPVSGYLVLFESWLKHEVPANATKKERISISFNYGWNN
jgi:uncharacterized protein (TIGR02466 family)